MIYKVVFSKQAAEDLRDILQYTIENFGKKQYWIYRELIKEAIDIITEDPFHIASRNRDELSQGARTYHIRQPNFRASHFLLYRINQNKKEVELGRILHEKVDLTRQLPNNFR